MQGPVEIVELFSRCGSDGAGEADIVFLRARSDFHGFPIKIRGVLEDDF